MNFARNVQNALIQCHIKFELNGAIKADQILFKLFWTELRTHPKLFSCATFIVTLQVNKMSTASQKFCVSANHFQASIKLKTKQLLCYLNTFCRTMMENVGILKYGDVIYIVAEGWRDVPSTCIHGEWQELLPHHMNDSLALSCHWQGEK
jgi:hypothetical protein